MRLSRRSRLGSVPPNNVTYAHAINVCQKAETPDMKSAEMFLQWAEDDGVEPTVYMYASAIWVAQRCGNCLKALEVFGQMESKGCKANSVAFNGVISALCDHGNVERAVKLFELMKNRNQRLSKGTAKVSVLRSRLRLFLALAFSTKRNFSHLYRDWLLLSTP